MSGRDTGDRDGFLRRWSRRKTGADAPEPAPPEANAVAPPEDAAPPQSEDAEPADEAIADLPDIETLDKDSDYTVFLRDGVPEMLQRQALRKLWLSDPVLANLDGLNDYDDDFAAILKEGAEYVRRLVESGERLTRPGAEDETPAQTAAAEDAVDGESDPSRPAEDTADSGQTEAPKPRGSA